MKKLIQQMTEIENAKTALAESKITECGMEAPMEMNQGSPVSMNVSLAASGKDHVADLINMMKNAGMDHAEPAATPNLPVRQDMERLRGIVDSPATETYSNEPDAEYKDTAYMTKDLSGGINREKGAYAAAAPGDNPMAVEEGSPELTDEVIAAISARKEELIDEEGMEPEDAQEQACEEHNVDPDDFDEHMNNLYGDGEFGDEFDEELADDGVKSMEQAIKEKLLAALETKKDKPADFDPKKKAIWDKIKSHQEKSKSDDDWFSDLDDEKPKVKRVKGSYGSAYNAGDDEHKEDISDIKRLSGM